MKPITFTRHAPVRIAERGLHPNWIERTVRTPDGTEAEPADPTVERRFSGIAEMEGRVIRVVVRETRSRPAL
jgi:hypothetical protein